MEGIKEIAALSLGLFIGLFLGYQLNVEKSAGFMAVQMCNTTQTNLNTMIDNYNIIVRECKSYDQQYKDISILPGSTNQTVKVYVP